MSAVILGAAVLKEAVLVVCVVSVFPTELRYHWIVEPVGKVLAGTK